MKMVFSISRFTCNLLSTSNEEELLPLSSTRKVLAETQPGSLCHAEITCSWSHAHQRTHPWGPRDGLPWTGLGHIPTPVVKGGRAIRSTWTAWPGRQWGWVWAGRSNRCLLHLLTGYTHFPCLHSVLLSYLYLSCEFSYNWILFMVRSLPFFFPFGKCFQACPEVACFLVSHSPSLVCFPLFTISPPF